MSTFQQTIILGYVGAEPSVTNFPNGGVVVQLSIATSERWKDRNTGETREKTNWHNCVFRNKQAEVIGQYVNKGDLLQVIGRNETRKWTNKEGKDVYVTEVICDRFTFMPKNNSDNPGNGHDSSCVKEDLSKDKMSEEEKNDLPF